MTGTAMSPMESFQKQLADRLRDDIGKLLPDAVIQAQIENVLHEMLTRRPVIKVERYNEPAVLGPSEIEKAVAKQLDLLLARTVADWVDSNKDALMVYAAAEMSKGFEALAFRMFSRVMTGLVLNEQQNFVDRMRTAFQSAGMHDVANRIF